jgi:phage shock protein PspC (stress-responsive transcriptional regulator)
MNGTLTRSTDDKIIGGVAGGIARYIGADVSIVRIVTALLVVFTGLGWLVYLLLWAILPEAGTGSSGLKWAKAEAEKAWASRQPTVTHNADDLR